MRQKLSIGQLVLLFVLFAILGLAVMWAVLVWNTGENVMDKHGWIALGLGTFFSLLVGCGLMPLMFFSSRSGHDKAADPFRIATRQRSKPSLHATETNRRETVALSQVRLCGGHWCA